MIYAVIDTNVFISALITKNSEAPTVKVLEVGGNDSTRDRHRRAAHTTRMTMGLGHKV